MTMPDEVPRPDIKWLCGGCRVNPEDVDAGRVIVDRWGIAHLSRDYGMTRCDQDATGPLWWWPL